MERDEDVRMSCFLALSVLQAQFGNELSYKDALARGFAFRGRRVPFLNYQKGIYRAAVQRGPAALSIQTSFKSPYKDAASDEGFYYDYRAGPVNQPDNRALRQVHALRVPIVYFVGTRSGWYEPLYPYYIVQDDPIGARVLVSTGEFAGPIDEPEPVLIENQIERRYATREVKVRLHQARFRGAVIPAYSHQCAICRLRETRLLDAAHIAGDTDPLGLPTVSNGLSLCTIHHRAFDQNLVGVSPDYRVHVSNRLLEEEDGPMLDVLKAFHGEEIMLPSRRSWRPDRERLGQRFELFAAA